MLLSHSGLDPESSMFCHAELEILKQVQYLGIQDALYPTGSRNKFGMT